jgi:hypothetical protein
MSEKIPTVWDARYLSLVASGNRFSKYEAMRAFKDLKANPKCSNKHLRYVAENSIFENISVLAQKELLNSGKSSYKDLEYLVLGGKSLKISIAAFNIFMSRKKQGATYPNISLGRFIKYAKGRKEILDRIYEEERVMSDLKKMTCNI